MKLQKVKTHTEESIAITAERRLIKVEMEWKYCAKEESEYEMTNWNKNDFERVERGEIIRVGNRNKAKKERK